MCGLLSAVLRVVRSYTNNEVYNMIEPWALGMLLKIISARSKCICTTGGRSDDVDCEDIAH